MTETKWQPDGWWRVLGPHGELWCETSDEHEVRAMMDPHAGHTLWHHERRIEERWIQDE